MKKISFLIISFSFFLTCATGSFVYTPLNKSTMVKTTLEIEKSKDDTWNQLIAGLSSGFFVINNIDKQSGFINISYSGDPEEFVDSGELNFSFTNLRGERKYQFPASRAYAKYETMIGGTLCFIERRLDLEGRINLLLSEITPLQSRLTINIKYILNLKITGSDVMGNFIPPQLETISFTSNQLVKSNAGTEYSANGKLEQTILNIFEAPNQFKVKAEKQNQITFEQKPKRGITKISGNYVLFESDSSYSVGSRIFIKRNSKQIGEVKVVKVQGNKIACEKISEYIGEFQVGDEVE